MHAASIGGRVRLASVCAGIAVFSSLSFGCSSPRFETATPIGESIQISIPDDEPNAPESADSQDAVDLQSTSSDIDDDRPISSEPNLAITAAFRIVQELDNGMMIVKATVAMKNASSAWWSYRVNASALGPPKLETLEGFSYNALESLNVNHGRRWVLDIPPGLTVTRVGETYDSAEFFSLFYFEIPVGSNPWIVAVPYSDHASYYKDSYDARYAATGAGPTDPSFSPDSVFDATFHSDFKIHQAGEPIAIDSIAEVIIDSPGTLQNGTLPITMTITNLSKGYLLEFNFFTSTSLIFSDGTLAEDVVLSRWLGGSEDMTIGVGQSRVLTATFMNPKHLPTWLIVRMVLDEQSPDESKTKTLFVVELPR